MRAVEVRRRASGKLLTLCLCGAAIAMNLATGVSAIADTEYINTVSGRIAGPPEKKARQPKYQRAGSRIILRSESPLDESWNLNIEMSRGCRHGYFKQRADRRYVAILGADVYGAAIGGHRSLVDRVGLSKPQVIYVFGGQGTTQCRVYHRNES